MVSKVISVFDIILQYILLGKVFEINSAVAEMQYKLDFVNADYKIKVSQVQLNQIIVSKFNNLSMQHFSMAYNVAMLFDIKLLQ